jgi:predicted P-loop ATPase
VPLLSWEDMPVVDLGETAGEKKPDVVVEDFKAEDVCLISSELPESTVNMILTGEGLGSDRSAALFTVTIAMVKARFTDNEILSVLTDKENFLGETAYSHAQTTSRKRAAAWLARYTLAKVKAELSAAKLFDQEVIISEETQADIKKQAAGIKGGKTHSDDWQAKIEREGGKPEARPKASLKNLCLILRQAVSPGLFKYDNFALRITYGVAAPWGGVAGESIRDVDPISIKHWLAHHHRFEPSVPLVWEAILKIAEENKFHPIQDYLRSLPEWDGVPRIAGWLKKHFHAHGPDFYLDEVFEKWLVGAVTRVFEPGAKFDWMLILEGDQDIGKSSFIEILASPKYFIDKLPDLGDKDAAQALQGIWLVEMGELKELKRNEIETVKGFITRRIDKYRPSYGRATIEAPRQCLFAGSTNAEKYLKDDTGNRRFVPVRLSGHLDFAQLEEDRSQLWAEALAIYDSGFGPTGELSGEAKEYLKTAHAVRMTEDDSNVMQERILDCLETNGKDSDGNVFNFERFKLLDLFSDFGPLKDWKAGGWTSQLAGRAIKRLGARQIKIRGRTHWRIMKSGPTPPGPLTLKRKK